MSDPGSVPDEDASLIDSLYRISSLVGKTEDPKEALSLVLDTVVSVLDGSSASVSLIDPDTKRLIIEAASGLPQPDEPVALALGEGITGWVALHHRPLVVPRTELDPRYVQIREGIRSEIAVPLEDQGQVIGVLNVDSDRPDAFSTDDLKILTLLTREASRVIGQIWALTQLRTRARQMELLVKIGQKVVSKKQLGSVLDSIAEEARALMNCDATALFILSPNETFLRLHSLYTDTGRMEYEEDLHIDESSIGAGIRRRKQVEVHDLAKTEEHHFVDLTQNLGLTSMLATPIVYEKEIIGILNAYTRRPHRFNNDEKQVFTALASLGAVAIENSRLYSRIFESEEILRRNEKLTTLGQLSSELAHEIRSPLTVIKLLFNSLKLDLDADDMRTQDIRVIREKLDQLEEIASRFLSYGRSKSGQFSTLNLDTVIAETLQLVRIKLFQSRIHLEYEPSKKEPIISANRGQIQQVLLNLILNAVQAIEGPGTLRIKTATRKKEQRVQVTIEDTGKGIPDDLQSKIFDSFLTHRTGGTGLGLAIVKSILRGHRGDIRLNHSTPEGSSFSFWLPAAKRS